MSAACTLTNTTDPSPLFSTPPPASPEPTRPPPLHTSPPPSHTPQSAISGRCPISPSTTTKTIKPNSPGNPVAATPSRVSATRTPTPKSIPLPTHPLDPNRRRRCCREGAYSAPEPPRPWCSPDPYRRLLRTSATGWIDLGHCSRPLTSIFS
ncbi:uncharacterized protein M6B38_398310 [Iris pallida]|uniref:Uncharacterized protein n=1 Tax=Iris pallida TaxID=29817 RepID=A0AAX6FW61_IRIPA|nr:uncharacterized protein M6B38_398305 [Iris pallida]KAJ6820269.1 uncharacterized protein M6B38_398310 [Iris pallida]